MANPTPEVSPEEIDGLAAVVATGRSDYPNQINNVLAFPGIFRGALDVRAREITERMEVAAGHAIAATVGDDELAADYIVPSVFNRDVVVERRRPPSPRRADEDGVSRRARATASRARSARGDGVAPRAEIPYRSQYASPELAGEIAAGRVTLEQDPRWREAGARDPQEYVRWARCGCGMACLQMILAARGDAGAGARRARPPRRIAYGGYEERPPRAATGR